MESDLRRGSLVYPGHALTLDRGLAGQGPKDSSEYFSELVSLLQLTPNLASAGFRLPGCESYETLPLSGVSLTFLKRLALATFDQEFLLDRAATIIRLAPNLEVLHCHDCAEVTFGFLGSKTLGDAPHLQNLTELSLTNSSLTASSLRNLLGAVGPKLTKVSIRPRRRADSTTSEDDVQFDQVLAALQSWRQTLRELSFCVHGIQLPEHLPGLRVLREFRALQILQAEANFFEFYTQRDALTSTLPPSVRELRLLGFSRLTPALQDLLEVFRAGKFPGLSRIEIDDQEFEPESPPALELRQVGADFLYAGVDFVVHECIADSEDSPIEDSFTTW
ncbi:hypothetical protein NKR23_g1604 [Pleurostoma richardsiae]|uniref:Uncharacterized protein n=1 Tax=Pleurostoma richardsiae TaxID=41990 RepID=A0AA38VVK2_9PEZI|nr:hypothetical protein NKR23_g1604 [Pleurostoma richardsiae]